VRLERNQKCAGIAQRRGFVTRDSDALLTHEFQQRKEDADHGASRATGEQRGEGDFHGLTLACLVAGDCVVGRLDRARFGSLEQVDQVGGVEFDGGVVVEHLVLAEAVEVDAVEHALECADKVDQGDVIKVERIGLADGFADEFRIDAGLARCRARGPEFPALVEDIGGVAVGLVREELLDERGPGVFALFAPVADGRRFTPRGEGGLAFEHAAFDLHQRRGHDEELACGVDIDLCHAFEGDEELLGHAGDRDVVDVQFIAPDEKEQEVEGPLECIELDDVLLHAWVAAFPLQRVYPHAMGTPGRDAPADRPADDASRAARRDDLALAREVLLGEAGALSRAADLLDAEFTRACDIIEVCTRKGGTVLVTGLGKSGLIGAKISATFASLGAASHSVHPTEAAHGDLGRFRTIDCCLCLSNSGETEEVINLAAVLRQDGLPIIAITNGSNGGSDGGSDGGGSASPSSLERLASATLRLGVSGEAGGMPAPTSSTTTTLAIGDALAICVAARLGFTRADFARRHPGGNLGRKLLPVVEIMRHKAGENLALIDEALSVRDALESAALPGRRRPGAMLIVDGKGVLSGIFTDGDLRRLVRTAPEKLDSPIAAVMTRSPRWLGSDAIVEQAIQMVLEHRQDEIPILDASGRPVGLLDVQDLVALRLVTD